jgi:hypothetical protein
MTQSGIGPRGYGLQASGKSVIAVRGGLPRSNAVCGMRENPMQDELGPEELGKPRKSVHPCLPKQGGGS